MKCQCCNVDVEYLHKHHILPKSLGGTDLPTNIVECCESCHGNIHGRNMLNHSRLTSAGLAAAKARGVQLGAYRDGVYVGGKGNADTARNATEARTAKYRANSLDRLPLLKKHDPDGTMSLRAIADIFNRQGVPTVSGRGHWQSNSVRRLKLLLLEEDT